MDEERESKFIKQTKAKKLPKVNKELAAKLHNELSIGEGGKKKVKKIL